MTTICDFLPFKTYPMPTLPLRSLRRLRSLVLAAFACAALPVFANVLIDDHFDNNDPTGTADVAAFWKLQTITGDNGVFENNSFLTLFATNAPYTFAGMNTALDPRLNFFAYPITFTAQNIVLDHKDVPDHEAVFRVSINSTELRQNMSPQSVSLRFVPGLALFGFKTGHVEKMAAEDLSGTKTGSAIYERFDGKLTGFSLTLDPLAEPGYITATLLIQTDGSRAVISRSARLDLRLADWGPGGASALMMEARRNTGGTASDSYMSASIDRFTITTYPR